LLKYYKMNKLNFPTRFVLIILILFNTSCTNTPKKAESIPEIIDYKIIEQWDIPNGGKGKIIAIDSNQNSIEKLKKIGERLNYEAKDDRHAMIFLFNDEKAGLLYHRLSNLTKKEESFYDKHFVAVYNKNINTGFNQFQITKDGLDGQSIVVKY